MKGFFVAFSMLEVRWSCLLRTYPSLRTGSWEYGSPNSFFEKTHMCDEACGKIVGATDNFGAENWSRGMKRENRKGSQLKNLMSESV